MDIEKLYDQNELGQLYIALAFSRYDSADFFVIRRFRYLTGAAAGEKFFICPIFLEKQRFW